VYATTVVMETRNISITSTARLFMVHVVVVMVDKRLVCVNGTDRMGGEGRQQSGSSNSLKTKSATVERI